MTECPREVTAADPDVLSRPNAAESRCGEPRALEKQYSQGWPYAGSPSSWWIHWVR